MKLAHSVVLLLVLTSPAFAGDQEANALLRQAYDHWKDPQPAEALRLAEEALAQNPTNQVLRTQIQLFLGSLHQVKTGNLDVALEKYDAVIRSLVGVTDTQLLQLKAEAMTRKGNILYSEKDDADGALRLYQSANQAFQQSTTVDTAAQLAYRMGRDDQRSKADRDTLMEFALKASQEAVQIAPRQFTSDAARQANNLAKCQLQLVIVLTALGRADEATAAWNAIAQDKLNEGSLYQQAILHALKGDGDAATAELKRFLSTRPAGDEGALARNQLRKFIRTEPDFAALRSRPDWKELIEDEPIRAGR